MSRVEQLSDDVRLILGDCRDELATLRNVVVMVTDPPYTVTSGGFGNLEGGFGGWIKDAYDNKGKIVACDLSWSDWLSLVPQALADNAHAYIFSNDRNLTDARVAAEAAGLKFHRLLIWDKRAALPNRWYQQTCEFVLFMRKGKAFMITDPSSKSLQSIFQRDETDHPTEKPVELCELYISNSSKVGDLVFDPFLGSGTTAVAAANLGRKFVGCEIDQKWFDVACKRVEQALKRPRLNLESRAKQVQEAMQL